MVTAVVAVVFLLWANAIRGDVLSTVVAVLAAVAWLVSIGAAWIKREFVAFFASALTIGLAVVSLFLALFPDVMPSSTDPAYSLTTTNAASTEYTLTIMTVVAVIFVPIVLIYQGWTYYVFRKRVTTPRAGVEA
jgi:cytochrome d ubiquinol oxidase subunit II